MLADRRYRYAALLLLVMTVPAIAGDAEEEAPSPALLDYLGGWELDNGQRIDPIELDRMDVPRQENQAREKDAHKDR